MKKSFLSVFFVFTFCGFIFGQEPPVKLPPGNGMGSGKGSGNGVPKPAEPTFGVIAPLRISSKPRANYTDLARKNGTEGTVRLRVTFLASGVIGSISPVSGLPDGLTEQAIAAARSMKFEPATKGGVPVSVTKSVEYSFSIYYDETDENLAQIAEILEQPEAERPAESSLQDVGGRVKILVFLNSNGTVSAGEITTDLPKAFAQKAIEAASKIKFKPAIHKNGKAVTQIKEIEYEFSKR